MLTSSAEKRLSIINVKSGTGDIPGMRHGKHDRAPAGTTRRARRGRANGFG